MTPETSVTAFFGDREHTFKLTPRLVIELEALTGAGIGGIFRRMTQSEFKQLEITETLRLGLIGGGTDPETAARLVATYVPSRPLIEAYSLAVEILSALMFGKAPTSINIDSPDLEAAMMSDTLTGGLAP